MSLCSFQVVKKKFVSRNTSRRHIVQSTILFSLYNWCPALEKQVYKSQFYLRKKTKPFFSLNNTHNYWLKFQTSGGKCNQKASKTTHTPQARKHTHLTSPSTGLVFRSPSRKQILTPKANTEQNWAFIISFKSGVREILNDIQNMIHLSCLLPLNSNFSHI